MKIFKNVALALFSIILFLTIVIGGSIFWATRNPQQAWKIVEQHILPEDMFITWKEIELHTKHLGGLNYHFEFKVEKLHLKKKEPLTDFPVDSIQLEFSILPFVDTQRVVVQRFVFKSTRSLMLKLGSSKNEQAQNPFQNTQKIFKTFNQFKRNFNLQYVDIQLKELILEQSDNASKSMSLVANMNMKKMPRSMDIKFSLKSASDQTMIATGNIASLNSSGNGLLFKGEVKGESLGTQVNQKVEIKLSSESVMGFFSGSVYYKTAKTDIKASTATELKMNSKAINIDLKVQPIKGVSNHLASLRSLSARFKSEFVANRPWMENPSYVSVTAPIDIFFFEAKLKEQLERECACLLHNETILQVDGKIWLSKLVTRNTRKNKVGDFTAHIQSLSNKLFTLKAGARLEIEKLQNNYFFIPYLDVDLQVSHFLKLAKILAKKGVLIPAPLDILDGTISLKVNGPVKWSSISYSFPLQATVKLSSSNQFVDLQVDSDFELSSNFKSAQIATDVMINKLQLELPPLTPTQGKPRIIIDNRILRKAQLLRKCSGFKITLSYQIHTKVPDAIRLLSKYFKPYLPLSLNIQHSANKENSGFIRIGAFDIVYLRRKVHVERMSIDLTDVDKKIFIVDGRLSIKQTQYTIFIDVKGQASQPDILLSSVPYLSRSEIISVLLYNRTRNQLASSDVATVGHVGAAIADNAIGLFGIWAFAATPIKSFSYNSATRIYTATIELADGVSTSIGSNWEEEYQVALSKRVSRRWTITAAWLPAGVGKNEQTNLVLQWEKRF